MNRNRSLWLPARLLALAFAALVTAALPAQAQSIEEQLREMRREMERMAGEIRVLQDEVRRSRAPAPAVCLPAPEGHGNGTGALASAPPQMQAGQQPAAEAMLAMVQSQVAELAQTKVESSSRLPVKLFGTIVSSTFFNSGEANWTDIPNLVDVRPTKFPRGSFSSNMRQSRIGAIVEGPTVGNFRTSAFLAFDFFGGIPNFQTGSVMGLPRLLYAYARIESQRTAFQIGQDQMILAPNNPTSLAAMAFPNFFRSGNLYLRVPQIRVERTIGAGEKGEFQFMAGILAPVAGDFSGEFEFVPPKLSGERSRQPAVQGRVAWSATGGRALIGIAGHTSGRAAVADTRRSWAVATDFDFRFSRFGFGGEWFVGQHLTAFGGSLGQGAKSTGGFIEGRVKATERLEFNAGFGADHLLDLNAFSASLRQNASVFANFIYQFTPEFATSFEYRWLSTKPVGLDPRRNNHLNLVFAYRF